MNEIMSYVNWCKDLGVQAKEEANLNFYMMEDLL